MGSPVTIANAPSWPLEVGMVVMYENGTYWTITGIHMEGDRQVDYDVVPYQAKRSVP